MLDALGFSPAEEQVYGFLVARGRLTLAEVIAERADLPRCGRLRPGVVENRTLDGHIQDLIYRPTLSSLVRPDHVPGSPSAMANELGLRNVAFEVPDLQAAVDHREIASSSARLPKRSRTR